MDFIVNEVELKKAARQREKEEQLKKEGKKVEEEKKEDEEKKVVICRTNTDVQKRKLDKLMSDLGKEVYIPEPRKEWKPRDPAEFVRHVMGSSAGAGSGEFHVYRGIRKRENKRQDYLNKKSLKDELDEQYQNKLLENQMKADEATAKKRAKRQRKKKKKSLKKPKIDNMERANGEEDISILLAQLNLFLSEMKREQVISER